MNLIKHGKPVTLFSLTGLTISVIKNIKLTYYHGNGSTMYLPKTRL